MASTAHGPGSADTCVSASVALGWEMADQFSAGALAPTTAATALSQLPGPAELSPDERAGVGSARLAALAEQALGASADVVAPLLSALGAAGSGPARPAAIRALHVELLTALEARDGTLARAYELGRALAETAQEPRDLVTLLDRLDSARVVAIEGQLADLSSRLPAHSASAVAATLEQWQRWTGEARAREDLDGVRAALARQRALWRVLLTGEKDGRQMLDPDTVVAASVRHASRLGTLIRGLTGAYLPVLFALTLSVVLLLWTIVDQTGIATVIAALGALAATMVGIRKSLALTAQDTIDELRGDLWTAELDAAVAQSILRLPPTPAAERRSRLPLGRPAAPTTADTAPGDRMGINQRIERALHVTTAARRQGLHVAASGPGLDVPGPIAAPGSRPEPPPPPAPPAQATPPASEATPTTTAVPAAPAPPAASETPVPPATPAASETPVPDPPAPEPSEAATTEHHHANGTAPPGDR